FFCLLYCAPPSLPSFPTRRSSDLSLSLVACGASTWVALATPWGPAARLNPSGDPFWIGVRLIYDHPWQTNFLWWNGTVQWTDDRSEEHTSELQSRENIVCRLLLEK